MKSYTYVSNTYVSIQGVDEVEEYNNTIKAMHIMGINNDDIICNTFKPTKLKKRMLNRVFIFYFLFF